MSGMPPLGLPPEVDVVVVGSGIVGAACAYELALAGRRVLVVDRGHLAAGSTATSAGDVLVSDRVPGPALQLARVSASRWRDYAYGLARGFDYEPRGGLVIATGEHASTRLATLAERQREAGVTTEAVTGRQLRALESHLAPDIDFGVRYPDDAQVQPVLASSALLEEARELGAVVVGGCEVLGFEHHRDGRVAAVRTAEGTVACEAVVNAAGPWAGALARLAGSDLPVVPGRTHFLVTEPVGLLVHHMVREFGDAELFVSDAATHDPARLAEISPTIASTPDGRLLLGSSHQLVGFDASVDAAIVHRLAHHARRLFPVLAGVALLRVTVGHPATVADRLPVIGEDPAVRGLWHATGHAGANVGLAPVTGQLVRAGITGTPSPVDPLPFRVQRPTLRTTVDTARTDESRTGGSHGR
jgi:D-hydroxyproline dehydrogenase subunit beta